MTIQQRKERERDERRSQILSAANQIIEAGGIEALSIRKIAEKIEYSPAIIYRFFADKEDIVNRLLEEKYNVLVQSLTEIIGNSEDPVERLQETSRGYIDIALKMSGEYLSVMLNNTPAVLQHTSVLFQGAAQRRQAVGMLCSTLKEINKDISTDDVSVELTAQVIWAATFGLATRLIIERDLPNEQRQLLIDRHIEILAVIAKSSCGL